MAGVSIAIVLLGESTWSRRFVDWEIAASLGNGDDDALALVSCSLGPPELIFPPRLAMISGQVPTISSITATNAENQLSEAVALALDEPVVNYQSPPLLRMDLRLERKCHD